MSNEAQSFIAQLRRIIDLISGDISDRHFSGGREIIFLVALQSEQIGSEFWQLTGAC